MTGFESKRQASKEGTHPDPWRDAIDEGLVCAHIGTAESFPTAQAALDALINWHIATALDPEVSSSAQALIDRGAAAVAEPVARQWLNSAPVHRKKLPKFAEVGAWNPLYAAPQAVAEPLSDERVNAILMVQPGMLAKEWFFAFARAIEQAHGIKGSKT